jgi:hypothetical protein
MAAFRAVTWIAPPFKVCSKTSDRNSQPDHARCRAQLERVFREYGLPRVIRFGLDLRGLGRQQPALKARRISLRSAQCDRAAMHRVHRLAAVSAGLQKVRSNGLPVSVSVRSPPMKLGPHQGSDRARLRMLLFAWTKLRRHNGRPCQNS